MKKSLLIFLGCLFVTSLAFAAQDSGAVYKRGDFYELYKNQSPDDLVMNYMQRYDVAGMQCAIVQAPYIPRNVGYGEANLATKQLFGTNTVVPIGQMTEGFTDVAVMQLVDQGKIKLDDKISQFVKDLPNAWKNITIKQLIAQSTGIPDYTKTTQFDQAGQYKPQQLLALVEKQPLAFKPGTQVANSATNYVLLGLAIEKASGMTYQEFVKKYQFEPLKLKATFFMPENPVPYKKSKLFLEKRTYINPVEIAQGYQANWTANIPAKPFNPTAYFANGSIVSNAYDISIWDVSLAGNILIKNKASREFLYNATQLENGKTIPSHGRWQFPGHPGLMYIKGYAPGYSALLDRFTNPKELLCVTLTANKANLPDLAILARKIAAAYQTDLKAPDVDKFSVVRQSPYSVAETAARIQKLVKAQGGKVFTIIDQSEMAKGANLQLSPTIVLLFGNPKAGTILMQNDPNISSALPLRATIWKGPKGQVWLSYSDLVAIAKSYKYPSDKMALVKKMYVNLTNTMLKATSAN